MAGLETGFLLQGFSAWMRGIGASVLIVSPITRLMFAYWHLYELQVGEQKLAFLTLSSSKLQVWTQSGQTTGRSQGECLASKSN